MKIPQTATFNTATQTLAELQKFMADAGDGAKIIGKKNANEEVILFVKPGASTFGARISGKADERRELARTAINDMITKAEASMQGSVGSSKNTSIFNELRASISDSAGRSLVSGEIRTIATALAELQKLDAGLKPPAASQPLKFEQHIDPSLVAKTGPTSSVPGRNGPIDLPTISIGGKVYEPVKFLTFGGFADIYLYRNTADHSDQMALKTVQDLNAAPKKGNAQTKQEEARQIFEREIVTHVQVGGGQNANPNILKAEAGVRMPDGSPAILLEFAPGGNLADFSSGLKLSEGNGPGQCPKALADVLRSDMMIGVGGGCAHLEDLVVAQKDLKGQNVLLTADGDPRISDFGEAVSLVSGEELSIRDFHSDSEFNSAPELLKAMTTRDQHKDGYAIFNHQQTQSLTEALSNLDIPKNMQEDIGKVMKNRLKQAAESTINDHIFVNARDNDRWALGTIFAEIISGNTIMYGYSSFKAVTADALMFRSDNDSAVGLRDPSGALPKGALVDASGNEAFDSLLNQQLSQNPSQRLSAQDALRQPAMRLPGVGGPDVRAFKKVQMEMSHLRNEQAAAKKDLDETMGKVGRNPIDPATQAYIQKQRDALSNVDQRIRALVPRYEAAKSAAMTEIGLAQLDNAGRDLGRARDEIVERQQESRAIDQLGRDAIRMSDLAMALESGEPLVIRG